MAVIASGDPALGGVEQRIMPGWAWDGMWRMPGRYMWLVAPAGGRTAHTSWPDSLVLAEMAACRIEVHVQSTYIPTGYCTIVVAGTTQCSARTGPGAHARAFRAELGKVE